MEGSPCPNRIIEDLGSAFAMGCVGGGFVQGIKGLYYGPKSQRMSYAIQNVALRTPTVGGNFALWGGLFSLFDCSITAVRGTHDSYNAIAAGTLTGGALAFRAGWKACSKHAFIGGALLAVIEGLSGAVSKFFVDHEKFTLLSSDAKQAMMSTDVSKTSRFQLAPAFTKLSPLPVAPAPVQAPSDDEAFAAAQRAAGFDAPKA